MRIFEYVFRWAMALVLIARWFSVVSGTSFSFAKYYLANNTSYDLLTYNKHTHILIFLCLMIFVVTYI